MIDRSKPYLIRGGRTLPDGTVKTETFRLDSVRAQETPRHDALTPEQHQRATAVYWRVGRIARPDLTPELWADGFRYDTEPDREIALWETIANAYDSLAPAAMSSAKRAKTLLALNMLTMGTVDVPSQTGLTDRAVAQIAAALEEAYRRRQ